MSGFAAMLAGGHPNSLGRTVEVVDAVLAAPGRFGELFDCYADPDPVVRLRVSNAMKRIAAARADLLMPWIDRFLAEVGALEQASAQWTLAQISARLWDDLDDRQRADAVALVRRNLDAWDDWIVLNASMDMLGERAAGDDALRAWLRPVLDRLAADGRKSVAGRARRWQARLDG